MDIVKEELKQYVEVWGASPRKCGKLSALKPFLEHLKQFLKHNISSKICYFYYDKIFFARSKEIFWRGFFIFFKKGHCLESHIGAYWKKINQCLLLCHGPCIIWSMEYDKNIDWLIILKYWLNIIIWKKYLFL